MPPEDDLEEVTNGLTEQVNPIRQVLGSGGQCQIETKIWACTSPGQADEQWVTCQVDRDYVAVGGGAWVEYGALAVTAFRATNVLSTGYHVGMRHDLLNAVLLSSICAFPACGGDGPVNELREVESNNVGPTMPPLRDGETIHGAVDVYRDSDYFAVAFPGAGGNLRFKLEVKEKLRRSPDDFWQLMVVVQDQNRTKLGEFDLQKLGPVNVMEQTVGPVTAGAGIGTLEVRAGGFMPEGSRYSVTVNFD